VKLLNKIKKRRVKKASKAVLKASGDNYAAAFNRRSDLLNLPISAQWDGQSYIVEDRDLPDCRYRFRHERQGNLAYKNGFIARAKRLGREYFLDQVPFHDGDVVLDCGANVGDLFLWFRVNDLNITYVGFEPSPMEFDCLKQNVHPHTVHNVGLWNNNEQLTFYVSSQGADSSLIEPKTYDDKIVVETKRLDTLIDGKVKLLKLEAEGAEPEILDGLGEKLSDIEYVSADLGFERGVEADSTFVPVVNHLLSRNFELVDVRHQRLCALFRNKAHH